MKLKSFAATAALVAVGFGLQGCLAAAVGGAVVGTAVGVTGAAVKTTAKGAGTYVRLALRRQVTTRWLVVWLTSLPPAPGGYQGKVAEISVRS